MKPRFFPKYFYLILALLATVGIVYLSSIPNLVIIADSQRMDNVVSNLAHIPAYALLAFLWISTSVHMGWQKNGPAGHWLVVAGLILFSISDELHQSFVPGRTASIGDLMLDIIGITIGTSILALMGTLTTDP